MAGNPMISIFVRLQNIHSHKPKLYQGQSFEAVEDMISVDLFQDRTKARFMNHHQIICYYKHEVFLSRILLVQISLQIPDCFIGTSQYQHIIHHLQWSSEIPKQLQFSRPSDPDLTSKEKFYSKNCRTKGIGNLTQVCLVHVDLLY